MARAAPRASVTSDAASSASVARLSWKNPCVQRSVSYTSSLVWRTIAALSCASVSRPRATRSAPNSGGFVSRAAALLEHGVEGRRRDVAALDGEPAEQELLGDAHGAREVDASLVEDELDLSPRRRVDDAQDARLGVLLEHREHLAQRDDGEIARERVAAQHGGRGLGRRRARERLGDRGPAGRSGTRAGFLVDARLRHGPGAPTLDDVRDDGLEGVGREGLADVVDDVGRPREAGLEVVALAGHDDDGDAREGLVAGELGGRSRPNRSPG